ncbi:hypothetical protein [Streptomyces candidus]|nr:hypothetical protein [Streptomyces candidus]
MADLVVALPHGTPEAIAGLVPRCPAPPLDDAVAQHRPARPGLRISDA